MSAANDDAAVATPTWDDAVAKAVAAVPHALVRAQVLESYLKFMAANVTAGHVADRPYTELDHQTLIDMLIRAEVKSNALYLIQIDNMKRLITLEGEVARLRARRGKRAPR